MIGLKDAVQAIAFERSVLKSQFDSMKIRIKHLPDNSCTLLSVDSPAPIAPLPRRHDALDNMIQSYFPSFHSILFV